MVEWVIKGNATHTKIKIITSKFQLICRIKFFTNSRTKTNPTDGAALVMTRKKLARLTEQVSPLPSRPSLNWRTAGVIRCKYCHNNIV